jgi:hypothetical protein
MANSCAGRVFRHTVRKVQSRERGASAEHGLCRNPTAGYALERALLPDGKPSDRLPRSQVQTLTLRATLGK